MASLYRKYRPQAFKDVCGQTHVVQTIQNQISGGTVAHAYLFSGPRGVGKTTMARLLARAVNCMKRKDGVREACGTCEACKQFHDAQAMHIVEIDAASHTGVDNVRENIIDASRISPGAGKTKVFIIDEVHMLSASAFNALLKTLEEPPSHALFILATTELHKIPATILSRCQRFDFHRIGTEEIVKRLKLIAKHENVSIEDEVLSSIARLSEGCLRDAESLLEQVIALGDKKITMKEASLVLPHTDAKLVSDFVRSLSVCKTKETLGLLNTFVDQGGSVRHLIDELIPYVRSILFVALGDLPDARYGKEEAIKISEVAATLSPSKASFLLDALIEVRLRAFPEAFPQLPLELMIVEFCDEDSEVKSQDSEENDSDKGLGTPSVNTDDRAADPDQPDALRIEQETIEVKEEPQASAVTFTLREIQDKWGRCCKEVGKQNVAIPLVLQRAKPSAVEKGVVFISFEQAFHFETMSARKNIALLEQAIEVVMQCPVRVEPILEVAQDEKVLGDLVSAFGGSVVE